MSRPDVQDQSSSDESDAADTRPQARALGAARLLTAPFALVRDLLRDARERRALFALIRGNFWFVPAATVLALLASLFEGVGLTLVIPLVQSLGADPAAASASRGYLGLLQGLIHAFPPAIRTVAVLGLIFAAVLAKSVFSYANQAVLAVVYGRVSHRLRTAIFERILSTPLARMERQQSGKLLNALNYETWRATDAVNLIFVTVSSLATTCVFVALLVALSWKLALIAIVCFALVPPMVHLVSRRAESLSNQALAANEGLAQQTWSALNGLRTIHTFGRETYEQARFDTVSDRVRRLFLRTALVTTTTGPITEIMATGAIALLILLVSANFASISTLVAFIALLYRLQPRLVSLVSAQSNLASLQAPIILVNEMIEDGAPLASAAAPQPEPLQGPVSFRHVTFRYEADAPAAIQDLSFDLPRSGLVAVVGASGAGKSTFLDLLLGFQTPQSGEIRVGGRLLTEAAAPAWRGRLGVVNQDPYVFDDTVRANILYGRPDATEDEMVQAARAAAADEFIRALPQGYDTNVGERAAQLSGGQRQRIALARALLRAPDILLLDEATNALDGTTERAVQATLATFARDHVVVVVAHKLSTVQVADHVLMLQDGRLVEEGSPSALLAADGPFARIFASAASHAQKGSFAAGAGRT